LTIAQSRRRRRSAVAINFPHAMSTLAHHFLAHLPAGERARWSALGDLDARLHGCLRRARDAWRDVRVADHDFVRHLAERVPHGGNAAELFSSAHLPDLYLACACMRGDPAAVALLEKRFVPKIIGVLARRLPRGNVEESVQNLLTHLLVGGETPAIGLYTGRGSLTAWIRVSAARAAYFEHRGERRRKEREQRLAAEPAPGDDPELANLKRLYRPHLRRAFERALSALPARQRKLLRSSFVEGLSIDKIAQIHGTHRATAARWIAAARGALLVEVRAALQDELRADSGELDSVVRLAASQVELSLERLLDD
jgi:RNA polymerase sigma-70 factor (ECF subfamily)